jgi:hypothetical protein
MRATALVVALVLGLAGCTFSQRHPAVAAAIVGGAVGFGACEIDDSHIAVSTCGLVGGAAAVFLGGIVAIVTLFVDPEGHELPPEPLDEEALPPIVRHPHVAPATIDAGVTDAGPADAVIDPDA